MDVFSKSFHSEELGDFLQGKGASEEIVRAFSQNRIDGQAFVLLTEEDLRELVPLIGERTLVWMLLKQAKQVS